MLAFKKLWINRSWTFYIWLGSLQWTILYLASRLHPQFLCYELNSNTKGASITAFNYPSEL